MSITIVLSFNKDNFETLDEKEQDACIVENSIVEFLDFVIESIPIEAGKNWTKVCQFFEVIYFPPSFLFIVL